MRTPESPVFLKNTPERSKFFQDIAFFHDLTYNETLVLSDNGRGNFVFSISFFFTGGL
jgi:hypothetical protein